MVLAAVYLLWAYQQAFHREPDQNAAVRDLSWREVPVVAPLIALSWCWASTPSPSSTASPRRYPPRAHVEVEGTHQPVVATGGPARYSPISQVGAAGAGGGP